MIKALNNLDFFIKSQNIGLSVSFPDLLLYIFERLNIITENQILFFRTIYDL